jgi:hypothetical protein
MGGLAGHRPGMTYRVALSSKPRTCTDRVQAGGRSPARAAGARIESDFPMESGRTIYNDRVVRYTHRFFQLQRQSRHYAQAHSQVLVCEGRHGKIHQRNTISRAPQSPSTRTPVPDASAQPARLAHERVPAEAEMGTAARPSVAKIDSSRGRAESSATSSERPSGR